MISVISALLAALAYSLGSVIVRLKLDQSDFVSATWVITVTGNVILWPLALLFTNLRIASLGGVLFFAAAGMLGFGIGRILYFKSIEVVGVSITASFFGTFPMYTSILAVLLLSEELTPGNWIGIICIVVGVVFIGTRLSNPKTEPRKISRKGLVFPLLAAFVSAFSFILRKHGLNILNEPLLGVAIGYSSSFLLYLLLSTSSRAMRSSMFSSRDFRLFWKAGVCISSGWVLAFYALSQESVAIVTPLTQTQPLFVLFLAYLYLKRLEHTSLKLVVSTILIVIGVVTVSIY